MADDTNKKVREFMEGTKEKTAQVIKGKNIVVVSTNKIYKDVTSVCLNLPGSYGLTQFICDGVKIMTNAEIIITETE